MQNPIKTRLMTCCLLSVIFFNPCTPHYPIRIHNRFISLCIIWNSSKVTAHHGIIPTANKAVEFSNLSDAERKIYDLIRQRYIAQFLGDYQYVQIKLSIQCAGETFNVTSKQTVALGWKQCSTCDNQESDSLPAQIS